MAYFVVCEFCEVAVLLLYLITFPRVYEMLCLVCVWEKDQSQAMCPGRYNEYETRGGM